MARDARGAARVVPGAVVVRAVVLLLALGGVAGCATPSGARQDASDGAVLSVAPGPFREALLVPDGDATRVTLHLVVGAGEAATDGPEGLAHYVEHLAWLNTRRRTADERSSERDANAWTNARTTGYFETVPAADLEAGIARLAGALAPFDLDERFMREERGILVREHELRAGTEREEALRRDIGARVHAGSGFTRSALGTRESLAALTLADARALHARTHRPENTTLLVSGDVDARAVTDAVAALPSSITSSENASMPSGAPLDPAPTGPLVEERDERDVDGDPNAPPALHVVRRFVEPTVEPVADTPARRDARHFLLRLALDSTRPGGLAGPLRFDAFVAARYALSLAAHGPDQALLGFSATPDEGVALETLQRTFETTLEASAATGLPPATLAAVRKNLLAEIDRVDERGAFTHAGAIDLLSDGRTPYGFAEWRRAIVESTAEEIDALLASAADGGRTVIRRVTPAR